MEEEILRDVRGYYDEDILWFYIENGIANYGIEQEYFWYLIRKTLIVLSTQDMDLALDLLWNLEEFTLGSLHITRVRIIGKMARIVRSKIIGSNTSAERTLLLNETLTREVVDNHNNDESPSTEHGTPNGSTDEDEEEETLEEQRERIWQQAIRQADLELDYEKSASPAA